MGAESATTRATLRQDLDRLILRRIRVVLSFGLATVATFMVVNHVWWEHPPLWSDVVNVVTAMLIGIGLLLLRIPFIERRPIPFALLICAVGCGLRVVAAVWHVEVAPTAIMLVALALITAATLPWGVVPQIVTALCAGAAIALNSYLVDGNFGPPPGHAATTVALGLVISVVLAIELQRHRLQMLSDNLHRREAEARLAQLNVELEQRVAQRTAQLGAATQRLEREVQAHQRAVDDMRQSQRRLQEVLDHATAAIYLRDADGRYLVVNRYWEAVTNRRAADVIGKRITDVLPGDIAEALSTNDREVIASGQSMLFEEHAALPDGPRTFVSVKFPQFDGEGRPVGVWGISTDISERKRAEEQARRHQAELAHVLRLGTMGEMAAGLAHEINQPLGAVANYAQGSMRRLRDGSLQSSELLPIMEAIAHEALRAGEIIRRVRALVRKEAAEHHTIDLNTLVRESARFVDLEARQHNIQVNLDLALEPLPVSCDHVQIEQVILNLLRNAVEAVLAGPASDRRIVVVTEPVGYDTVQVTVRDDGVGLPEAPADVFAPFYSTKSHGLGMGLSISRSIIEAHHGQLWATRNADHGSTFYFTLPSASAIGSVEPAPATVKIA